MDKPFDNCARCGREISDMTDVGYLGPVDRTQHSCDPFAPFETVCAQCEGSAAV